VEYLQARTTEKLVAMQLKHCPYYSYQQMTCCIKQYNPL